MPRVSRLSRTSRPARLALLLGILACLVLGTACESAPERMRREAWSTLGEGESARARVILEEARPAIVALDGGILDRELLTGCIVHERGLILTAAHGIALDEAMVEFADGTRGRAEALVLNRTNDLAILKIVGPPRTHPVLEITSDFEAGQRVLSLGRTPGRPLHAAPGKILIEVFNSPLLGPSPDPDHPVYLWNVLVHDAPVFPGDSGGPILDLEGRLIGVSVSGSDRGKGGTAIPAARVTPRVLEWLARLDDEPDVHTAIELAFVEARKKRAPGTRLALGREIVDALELLTEHRPADLSEMLDWTFEPVLERATRDRPQDLEWLRPVIDAIKADAIAHRESGKLASDPATVEWAMKAFSATLEEGVPVRAGN